MRSRVERDWIVNRRDKCSKKHFRKRETLGYLLAKEKEPAERQSLSRKVMTVGAGSWGKRGHGGPADDD